MSNNICTKCPTNSISKGCDIDLDGHCSFGGRKLYQCVICGPLDVIDGVITHKNIPHPDSMTFDEEDRPQ